MRGSSEMPAWKPMPSEPTVAPTPNRGQPFDARTTARPWAALGAGAIATVADGIDAKPVTSEPWANALVDSASTPNRTATNANLGMNDLRGWWITVLGIVTTRGKLKRSSVLTAVGVVV